jgi:hypothetical protein
MIFQRTGGCCAPERNDGPLLSGAGAPGSHRPLWPVRIAFAGKRDGDSDTLFGRFEVRNANFERLPPTRANVVIGEHCASPMVGKPKKNHAGALSRSARYS